MAFVRRLREYEARIVAAHDAIAQIRERGSRWEQQARAWYTRAEAAQAHAQEAETRAQKAHAHAQKADAHAKEVDARAREALRELLGKAERAQGEMAGLRKALADAEQRAGAGAAQVEDARTESTELRRIVSEHDAARRQAEEVLASVKQQLAKVERDRQVLEVCAPGCATCWVSVQLIQCVGATSRGRERACFSPRYYRGRHAESQIAVRERAEGGSSADRRR